MNEIMLNELHYEPPFAQVICFPEQDIITQSGFTGPIELPEDEF